MATLASAEENVYLAKLAEQAERYDDMLPPMRTIAESGRDLTMVERNLLSVAYKNVVESRRNALKWLANLKPKNKAKGIPEEKIQTIQDVTKEVEGEMRKLCGDLLDLIDRHLLTNASTSESKVFFYKMKGDYLRYITELESEGHAMRRKAIDEALQMYERASNVAAIELAPTHPIRLGLALNFSVFYYEVARETEQACALAKQAFDDSIAELDSLVGTGSDQDSMLIMQMLRDNLTLWSEHQQRATAAATAAS